MSTTRSYDEKELLLLVAEGNEKAFGELIARHAGLLHVFLLKITRDPASVEELIQDTFLRIWMAREWLGQVNNFKPYMFTISRNLAVNLLRKSVRVRLQHSQWAAETTSEADENPDEWKWKLFDEAIERLPPQQKKVWIMARRDGKKYQQIADELGLSRESVKKYLQFASAAINRYISEHPEMYALFIIGLAEL
ncbi:RNA polymerase sigma-70 factor, ECF subfamily [Chitinophaga ginsengisegetis]|uniref:RNA polymerase sigma-70 factor, ECF subfamily n=1 Tax=Chitinophaga ginsengisegetis TaxID=393003 RepID=A0A1T5N629_9BACT|nr:RNA polymerase sigma factor [Chitinophaga ginsengisegetis]SKC95659.1 RNA polymerase sigma-70 factor, ECF subfamily [Chitinophaga ginsengisegetis]